jgi:nicotinamide-nucleotide amidase
VLPELRDRYGLATTVSRVVRTAGLSESGVAESCAALVERLEASGNPTIAFLASRGQTRVRVTAKAADHDAANALAAPVVEELVAIFGIGVVGIDGEGLEHAVGRQLVRLGWTLGLAESITGGGVGARLVRVPGASAWFRGALVTYASEVKSRLADVDPELLDSVGPVSEAVAEALAIGAQERLEADVGLAVVGVAGPSEQGGQPVGTVCLGLVTPDGVPRTRSLQLPGRERVELQEWAAGAALDFLRRRLAEQA